MLIKCEQCGSKYNVRDEKIDPDKNIYYKCERCGGTLVLNKAVQPTVKIQCPACEKNYSVDKKKITKSTMSVRCSSCQHFFQHVFDKDDVGSDSCLREGIEFEEASLKRVASATEGERADPVSATVAGTKNKASASVAGRVPAKDASRLADATLEELLERDAPSGDFAGVHAPQADSSESLADPSSQAASPAEKKRSDSPSPPLDDETLSAPEPLRKQERRTAESDVDPFFENFESTDRRKPDEERHRVAEENVRATVLPKTIPNFDDVEFDPSEQFDVNEAMEKELAGEFETDPFSVFKKTEIPTHPQLATQPARKSVIPETKAGTASDDESFDPEQEYLKLTSIDQPTEEDLQKKRIDDDKKSLIFERPKTAASLSSFSSVAEKFFEEEAPTSEPELEIQEDMNHVLGEEFPFSNETGGETQSEFELKDRNFSRDMEKINRKDFSLKIIISIMVFLVLGLGIVSLFITI